MSTSFILHTFLALLLLIIPFGALYLLDRPSIKPLAYGLLRGLVQLLAFSLIVWGVYRINNIWFSTGWLLIMSVWTGYMVVHKCALHISKYLVPASIGLFASTLLVGFWLLTAVLPIDTVTTNWFIAIMAILLGHSGAMLVRGLSNYVSMLQRNQAQYNFLLGNGASQWQALKPFIRTSILAITSPTIANLTTLSLAALPLLLCGLLIGGFSPINAFAIMMYAILGCIATSVLSLGITLTLVKKFVH